VSGGNTSQFVYGADGLRRTSIVNGDPVHHVLDNGMMVREMVPSGQTLIPKATYLIGPRGPEYRRDDQTQAIRWYMYDGLGSVLAEVDPSGNLTASRKHDVYGLVCAGGSGTSRHKFVGSLGHTSEDETGLIYMRARWMDPVLGRFISEDPARDGANWFEYCRGNPVNAVDHDGQKTEWWAWCAWDLGMGCAVMATMYQLPIPHALFFSQWATAFFAIALVGANQSHAVQLAALAFNTLYGAIITSQLVAYKTMERTPVLGSMEFASKAMFVYGLELVGALLASEFLP